MSLHDELQRLADTAPRPAIDHTVWNRGRALRRRDRLVTSAVVLVMVLIVGGLASLVIGPPQVVAPASDTVPAGAIPNRIYDVPAGADLALERDLAVGQASVAFVSATRLPVVISATDGAYHPLDLPHWGRDSVLVVSPSGDRLAWLSGGATGAPDPVISVLTLETGEVVTVSIGEGAGVQPRSVSWSPDGKRFAWLGKTSFGSAYGTLGVGNVDPESPTTLSSRSLVGIAVANDGALAIGTGGGLLLDADKRVSRKVAGSDGVPANFSPDGAVLALENRMIPSPNSSTLEVSTRKGWRHAFPADTLAPATTRPLGWLDDRLQLILAQESFDDDGEFIITTPKVGQTSTWRRRVGFVDPAVVTSLSVAVDLVADLDGTSSQQFTHDFEDPGWRDEHDISWMIGLGVVGVLSVLYGLRWLWRRRTPLG